MMEPEIFDLILLYLGIALLIALSLGFHEVKIRKAGRIRVTIPDFWLKVSWISAIFALFFISLMPVKLYILDINIVLFFIIMVAVILFVLVLLFGIHTEKIAQFFDSIIRKLLKRQEGSEGSSLSVPTIRPRYPVYQEIWTFLGTRLRYDVLIVVSFGLAISSIILTFISYSVPYYYGPGSIYHLIASILFILCVIFLLPLPIIGDYFIWREKINKIGGMR